MANQALSVMANCIAAGSGGSGSGSGSGSNGAGDAYDNDIDDYAGLWCDVLSQLVEWK